MSKFSFHCVSQDAVLAVHNHDSTFSETELGNGLTEEEFRKWYKNYRNPNNPQKHVGIIEWFFFNPEMPLPIKWGEKGKK